MRASKPALRRYDGPPGDDGVYWLPRDRDALDAAWDRYYAEHGEPDTSNDDTITDEIPF